eukprot:4559691-Amphidinium_carterae.1
MKQPFSWTHGTTKRKTHLKPSNHIEESTSPEPLGDKHWHNAVRLATRTNTPDITRILAQNLRHSPNSKRPCRQH